MNRLLVATSCAALAGAAATGAYIGVVTGRLTLDLGIGRRTRPLGPLHLDIAAPRDTVHAAAAAPDPHRQTRAMREQVEIRERAGQMVLAAHRTPVGSGLRLSRSRPSPSTRRTGWASGCSAARCRT